MKSLIRGLGTPQPCRDLLTTAEIGLIVIVPDRRISGVSEIVTALICRDGVEDVSDPMALMTRSTVRAPVASLISRTPLTFSFLNLRPWRSKRFQAAPLLACMPMPAKCT